MSIQQRVGFVGLGDMGEPMAHNLVGKGFHLTVFDVRSEPLAVAKDKGAHLADSLRALADTSELIGLCVWSETQLLDCFYGDRGLFASQATARTVLIHSTITPQMVQRLAADCAARGWDLVDAPVSGGRAGSVAGTLTLMVGGDTEAVRRCDGYLKAVGKNIFHIGDAPGAGSIAKLCNNMMALCNAFVVSEAKKLASAYGICEEAIVECARVSTGNSWFIENEGFFDNLLTTHPQPDVFYKDLWEAVEAGKQKGVELTISGLVALAGPRLAEERKSILRERG
ncbi:NAD(P)-dependent oxidoreductase [Hydrogenophaga sp. BPS33]|uniref:NAD(P)-dependent oxidoreductase n=1 Tax=Hydrogenophaga sp. BPS33 TaxID=2651974 RepID=UPI00131F9577|nr:NAD(P)-dependent oxidoreductase [Hydrogenophaga sp. BPS33]QHE84305.1 NAD(P)-dependent oxidoreductase [Hydrogenophaga sp. BPS33]